MSDEEQLSAKFRASLSRAEEAVNSRWSSKDDCAFKMSLAALDGLSYVLEVLKRTGATR